MIGLNQLKAGSLDSRNSLGAILGGGMDIQIWHGIYWRAFEADYVWAALHYSDVVSPSFPDLRRPYQNGVRLRTGLVISYGEKKAAPMTAACSVQPTQVMVGEPVTATANVSNANPKHTLTYDWSSTDGKSTHGLRKRPQRYAGYFRSPSATNHCERKLFSFAWPAQFRYHSSPCRDSASAAGPSPEQQRLEAPLALHCIYFPTAQPTIK